MAGDDQLKPIEALIRVDGGYEIRLIVGMRQPSETFKRGQVERALWRSFLPEDSPPTEPPSIFLTRIKRLLETDRDSEKSLLKRFRPAGQFAFSSTETEGQGVDAAFTAFDAFCLALALDLVDMGFKPSEVVLLLSNWRLQLQLRFARILRNPPEKPRPESSGDSNDPIVRQLLRRELPDGRVFWVIQKVEVHVTREVVSHGRRKKNLPVVIAGQFCEGIHALNDEVDQMTFNRWGHRRVLVLEIAQLAVELTAQLQKAPITKRGRA